MPPHQKRLLRIVTIPMSLRHLIPGQAGYFAGQGYQVMLASATGPELPDVLARESVPHTIIPFTRSITPVQDLWCLWMLIRLMRRWKPDIVHTQTPKAGLLGMLAARLCGITLRIHTVGGMPLMEITGAKRHLLLALEKLTCRCAHRVLPNSHQLARWMLQHQLLPPAKLQVPANGSSNGIDTQWFSPTSIAPSKAELRQACNIPPEAQVFIFIGRLVRQKGLVELAEAFQLLHATHPQAWLLLVGPWEQHLDPLPTHTVAFFSQHPRITLAGYQHDVRPWLKAADILVFPSYREGFPNVLMQAGAMELPIIATDINGCNEIVVPGQNGLLIPTKNPEQLLRAMQNLLDHPVLLADLGRQARQMISDRYQQEKVWEAIGQAYGNT